MIHRLRATVTSERSGTVPDLPPPALHVRSATSARARLRDVPSNLPVMWAIGARDLKSRYKQSLLGPAWTVFQPLALLMCFFVGFHSVAHVKTGAVPYLLFALSGLAVWSYVQAAWMSASGSIVNSYALVRWTACPRIALPLAALISNAPTLLVTVFASILASAIDGRVWIGWLAIPLVLIWVVTVCGAGCLLLGVVSVRARDLISALPFLLQAAMFLSPVAYDTSRLGHPLRLVVALNPLSGVINLWRWSVLHTPIDTGTVIIGLLVTVALSALAWWMFVLVNGRIADEI